MIASFHVSYPSQISNPPPTRRSVESALTSSQSPRPYSTRSQRQADSSQLIFLTPSFPTPLELVETLAVGLLGNS